MWLSHFFFCSFSFGIQQIFHFIRKREKEKERAKVKVRVREESAIQSKNYHWKIVRNSHSLAKCWWVNAKNSELTRTQQSRHRSIFWRNKLRKTEEKMKFKVLLFLLSLFYCTDYIAANNKNNEVDNLNGEAVSKQR